MVQKKSPPTIQSADFFRVLDMIVAGRKDGKRLTYGSIAKKLGRDPKGGPRYVGRVCNKLDAAAALGGVPVLALDVVRTIRGDVNPKAMPRDEAANYRPTIIKRANAHVWSEDDFAALRIAAAQLHTYSPKQAWAYVRSRIAAIDGVVAAYRQLAGIDPSAYVLKGGDLHFR